LLTAQWALDSNLTGKWHIFPYTSWKDDIPMGILYAIRCAKSALGRLYFHFFPILLMVFCRMFLILFLWCFNLTTFLGRYGVAILCFAPCSTRYCRKVSLGGSVALHHLWPSYVC
jgi:hypothetical protein